MREPLPSSEVASAGAAVAAAAALASAQMPVGHLSALRADAHKPPPRHPVYRAEGVEIDAGQGCVRRDGAEQPLRRQSFQVLLFLLARRNELVAKEDLAASFWQDTAVTDNALVQCIADIRRALGDDPRQPRFVKTVPRVGYRFIGPVEEIWPGPSREDSAIHQPALVKADGASGEPGPQITVPARAPSGLIAVVTKPASSPPRAPAFSSSLRHRTRWLALAFLLLAGVAIIFLYLRIRAADLAIPNAAGKKALAVMYFDNLSGRADLNWLREGLADMLITDLAQSDGLAVLSRTQLEAVLSRLNLKTRPTLRLNEALDVARHSRAEALIVGSFAVRDDGIVIQADLRSVHDGRLIGSEKLVLNQLSNLLGQIDLGARRLAALLGSQPSGRLQNAGLGQSMTRIVEAYQCYSTGVSKALGFQNADAIALLEKATRLDPQFAMAWARIGYAYAVTGFQPGIGRPYLERAMQLSERLTEKDRLYVRAWYAIASEDFPAAIRTLEEIVQAYPQEMEAYTRLTRLLYREERPEEALSTVRRGLAIQPEDGDLYNVMGVCFLGLHRYQEAIAAHRRYVQLAPREPNSHDSLGMSYHQAGRFAEAEWEYQQALVLDPGFEPAAIHLGDLRAQQGRYREAIRDYQRYLSLARGDRPRAVAYGELSEVYRRLGASAEAERAAAEELRLSKSSVWDSLVAAMDHHDVARAAVLRERLFADEPYPERGARGEMRSKAYYEGMLALREGEANRAIALFEVALKHLPPASGLDLHEDCLANAYLALARFDDAIAEYRRILILNPQYPLAAFHLAQAYAAKGWAGEAAAAYRAFLEQWKDADPDGLAVAAARKALQSL